MSNDNSMNDLDRAVVRMLKSHGALPDFMRCLSQGELWTYVPWHPEVENTVMKLENGMKFPFSRFEDKEGAYVAIFSSFERLREAMKKARFPARTVAAASMGAKELMFILGAANIRADVNRGCKTGSIMIGPDMMRDIASGKAFQSAGLGGTASMRINRLNPADYPTKLVQSAFDVLKQHRQFRAAWVFGKAGADESQDPKEPGYDILVLMEPRDEAVFHDLNLVVQSASGGNTEADLALVPDNDGSYTAQLFALAEPFYIAPDYVRPAPKKGEG